MKTSIVVLCALLLVGCAAPAPPPETAEQAAARKVERGKYLVTVLACGDCHTPFKMGPNGPEPDMTRMLAGHPEGLAMPPAPALGEGPWMWAGGATGTVFAGPWGLSYARNLTSDEGTGIGAWTEEMFVKAIRTGKSYGGGRPIMPPMPWPAYGHATDEDLSAVFAYLKTVPPIVNRSPDSVPAAPPVK